MIAPSSGNLASTGEIVIDGISITNVPRSCLRSRILSVPQDSVVLPGTVRSNMLLGVTMKPAVQDDSQLDYLAVEALKATEVWKLIESRGGLDSVLTSDTLSQGQLQLFALARTILRKNVNNVSEPNDRTRSLAWTPRILILDEATSHLDAATDAKIQALIEDEFKGFTVLIVAHRLETIAHADKVIILDNGLLVKEGPADEVMRSLGVSAAYS